MANELKLLSYLNESLCGDKSAATVSVSNGLMALDNYPSALGSASIAH